MRKNKDGRVVYEYVKDYGNKEVAKEIGKEVGKELLKGAFALLGGILMSNTGKRK